MTSGRKYLGNNFESSGIKLFKVTRYFENGKRKRKEQLVSWANKRCRVCQRFISDKANRGNRCLRCCEKEHHEVYNKVYEYLKVRGRLDELVRRN